MILICGSGTASAAEASWDDCAKLNQNRGHDDDDVARAFKSCSEYAVNPRYTAATRAVARYQLGMVWTIRGRFDQAIKEYEAAIALNPKGDMAPVLLAELHRRQGHLEEARSVLESALARGADRRRIDNELFLTNARLEARAKRKPDEATPPGGEVALSATPGALLTPRPAPPPTMTPGASVRGDRRVALVIGNGRYARVPALTNPGRDAQAIAAALRRIGFTAVRLEGDLGREKLVDALRIFAAEAESADWAVIYFAGHGIEIGGVNYLVPVDAKLAADRDIPFEAISLDQVMNAIEGASKLRLVLLDACRDNPFMNQMRRGAMSRSVGRGLAPIEPARGTLIAYAARHGQLALDGTEQNSPFATALLRHIATPGLEINKMLRLVRDDVLEATQGRQEPFTYGSLPGREDFFFAAQ
jgi:hypothetical protein